MLAGHGNERVFRAADPLVAVSSLHFHILSICRYSSTGLEVYLARLFASDTLTAGVTLRHRDLRTGHLNCLYMHHIHSARHHRVPRRRGGLIDNVHRAGFLVLVVYVFAPLLLRLPSFLNIV